MTNRASENQAEQSLIWRNRELWGQGLFFGAISTYVAFQRDGPMREFIASIITGTLIGCYIGYLFKCYREGKEQSRENS